MAMSTGRVVALIQAMGGGADPAVIESAVQDWLDAHPEATTTVQDGSITEQKLATSIAQKLGLISSLSDEIDILKIDVSKPAYGKSRPIVPLFPEMCADFAWCSMVLPASFTGKNVVFTVSGTSGSTELTVSAVSPVSMSDFSTYTSWIGGVLSSDGKAYKTYNFKYKTDSTLEIFPALDANVTDATLATLMYDSGESYVGLHLTENGYRAYAYYLYNQNPRHCEMHKYIDRFIPYDDHAVNPLVKFGSATVYQDFPSVSTSNEWLNTYASPLFRFLHSASYPSSDGKTGVQWTVDLKGKSGFFEGFISAITTTFDIVSGHEVYVNVYIDGVLKQQTIITNGIAKRICVDFDHANTGTLEIYCNQWTNGVQSGFYVNRLYWWVNDLEYAENAPLFPVGSVIAQEFDSWGVFHDGASGVALSALHDDTSGVSVPYTNHSLGNQTSAWGKAWWFENVWKYNPTIAITDFAINDTNSMTSQNFPATIEGPDGKTYDNKLTQDEYNANQKAIIDFALNNGIQPILMQGTQPSYKNFPMRMIDALAVKDM